VLRRDAGAIIGHLQHHARAPAGAGAEGDGDLHLATLAAMPDGILRPAGVVVKGN
jgi:hypothetical protein